ncbi:unnamed protein product [Merluccius merluccius]
MEAHAAGRENYVLVHTEHERAGSNPKRCNKALIGLTVALVVLSVLVGVLVYQWTKPACQESNQITLDQNARKGYDIFTAETTATYLIYGRLNCVEHTKDLFYLWQNWKNMSIQPIKTLNDSVIFEEIKVLQDSTVYLDFNRGQPTCDDIVFKIYQL